MDTEQLGQATKFPFPSHPSNGIKLYIHQKGSIHVYIQPTSTFTMYFAPVLREQ